MAVDSAGRYHIAAGCGGSIRYYVAPSAAGPWTRRVFSHPADRAETGPQIAIVGDRVYVAYMCVGLEDGGCGTGGADLGVDFRSRILPNGAWSAATRIGAVGDRLQSFQIRERHHAGHRIRHRRASATTSWSPGWSATARGSPMRSA